MYLFVGVSGCVSGRVRVRVRVCLCVLVRECAGVYLCARVLVLGLMLVLACEERSACGCVPAKAYIPGLATHTGGYILWRKGPPDPYAVFIVRLFVRCALLWQRGL